MVKFFIFMTLDPWIWNFFVEPDPGLIFKKWIDAGVDQEMYFLSYKLIDWF